jgi:hypothetical protein
MTTDGRSIKTTPRLDSGVMITMVIIAVISLGVFGFRYYSHKPCKPATISINATNFYTGIPLRFSSTASKDDKCDWSFGTKDNKKSSGQFVTFSYDEPGQYLIELTVNDNCKEYQFITIGKAPKMVNPALVPKIICPTQIIEVGKPVVFKDSTPAARTWEWRFGEGDKIDAMTQTAIYTFQSAGFKTVTLVVNGKTEAFASCQVFVNEKSAPKLKNTGGNILLPPINDTPKTKSLKNQNNKTATDAEIQAIMDQVVQGKKFVSDLTPYLCGNNVKIPVTYKVTGSKQKTIALEEACKDLADIKYRKIREVRVTPKRDPGTNCISSMDIYVRKKKGIIPFFK